MMGKTSDRKLNYLINNLTHRKDSEIVKVSGECVLDILSLLQELKERRAADKPLDIKGQLRLMRDRCPRIWERVRSDTACPVFFQLAGGECLAKNCKECWDKALEGDE